MIDEFYWFWSLGLGYPSCIWFCNFNVSKMWRKYACDQGKTLFKQLNYLISTYQKIKKQFNLNTCKIYQSLSPTVKYGQLCQKGLIHCIDLLILLKKIILMGIFIFLKKKS